MHFGKMSRNTDLPSMYLGLPILKSRYMTINWRKQTLQTLLDDLSKSVTLPITTEITMKIVKL